MTDNLEEFKRQWQQLSARVETLESTNRDLSERLARSKVSSLQDTLMRRYRDWSLLGLAFPLLAVVMWHVLEMPVWCCLIYALFGLFMCALQWSYARFIGAERLIDMPVADAIRRMAQIRLWRTRLLCIGIVSGVVLLGLMVWGLRDVIHDPAIYYGGGVGLIIGCAVGIAKERANTRLARKLLEQIGE